MDADMSTYMPPDTTEACEDCGAHDVPLHLDEDDYGENQHLWCAECCRDHGKEPNPWPQPEN